MRYTDIDTFKEKIATSCVIGIFSKTSDSSFIESCGNSGMDFCILDMEHGAVSYENLSNLIRACECSSMIPIVRVAENTEEYIGKALDLGAAGIQIPQIENSASAMEAIQFSKFYPKGTRGVCRYVRAAGYSAKNKYDYFSDANKTMVILQIEGTEGISQLDQILAVPGIDVIFIGPYDLSQSLGVTGDVHNPKVTAQMKRIIEKASSAGIAVGTFVDTAEDGCYWKNLGVRYIANSVDVGIFYSACRDIIDKIRQ